MAQLCINITWPPGITEKGNIINIFELTIQRKGGKWKSCDQLVMNYGESLNLFPSST